MEILLDTSRKLQMAYGEKAIAETVAGQLVKLLDKDVVYYPGEPREGVRPYCFPREKNSCIERLLTKDETAVASWSYRNNKHAGASTGTLPGAKGLYLAVRSANAVSMKRRWLWKRNRARRIKTVPGFRSGRNSSEAIFCGAYPMICGHRLPAFPEIQVC